MSTFQDILARVYIRIGVAQQAGNLIQRMCSANTIISSVCVFGSLAGSLRSLSVAEMYIG